MSNWYARFPVLTKDILYFVSGEDIFKIEKNSSTPQMCFQSTERISNLFPSEDSTKIACTSCEDGGPDLYIHSHIFEIQSHFFQNSSNQLGQYVYL